MRVYRGVVREDRTPEEVTEPMLDPKLEREISLMHSRVCYGVADPKRVLILYALEKGSLCVNELAEEVGMPQPAVSRHLRVLRERGLVTTGRRGPAVYYSLADHRLIEALDLLRAVLATQLDSERSFAHSLRETPRRATRPRRPSGGGKRSREGGSR
jgi:DNA-binding transcriptional ArsR family regulator